MALYEALIAPFIDYSFMQRALFGGVVLSLSAPPLGLFLMLRRLSLMGDAMGHALLPGVALAFILGGISIPLMVIGGLIAALSVAFFSLLIARLTLIKEDMAMAAFTLISLGLGVVLLGMNHTQIDILSLLFGSILALEDFILAFIAVVASFTLVMLALYYRGLVMAAIDAGFTANNGRFGLFFELLFMVLVVLNLVAGFHALGTLLVVGMMMLPAGIARLWQDEITKMMLMTPPIAAFSCWLGLLLSYHFNVPSGAAIILVLGCLYFLSLVLAPYGLLRRFYPGRHLEG